MSSMNDHMLDADKLKSGVRLPLFDKDGGISSDFLMVRWTWDDKVRAAMENLKREGRSRIVAVKPGMDKKQQKAVEVKNQVISDELVLEGMAEQVSGWSFDEKMTKANLKAFLKARPDIADRVDTLAANTKLFFTDSGASS